VTEKNLQASVLKKLRRDVGGAWVNKSPSPWDKVGVCDILGCLNSRFVAIELKRPGLDAEKHLTPAQAKFLAAVEQAGGVSIAASSWSGVYNALRNRGLIRHTESGDERTLRAA
jgi:hypothetical protein